VKQGGQVARVILDTRLPQLDRLFDYLIPEGMDVLPGCRVSVPLRSGARTTPGFVVELADTSDVSALQPISSVISTAAVLPAELWDLARAVAARQAGSTADVLRLAIPGRSVRVEQAWLARDQDPPAVPLPSAPEGLWGYPHDSLQRLVQPGQRSAFALTGEIDRGAQAVAQMARAVLSRGESAVVVVPDWRDLRTFQRAFQAEIPEEYLSVWDADATASQRYRGYLRALDAAPVVVLGRRHSVYAPVSSLGLMVVVDDADESHQEPLAPYPHVRDVALLRHQHTGSALVFASRVPSMNLLRWVDRGYLTAVAANHLERPRVIPTALSLSHEQATAPARLPSQAYQGVQDALREGPVLVQVFRAGFAPGLACARCREAARCVKCRGPLSRQTESGPPACRWCAKVHAPWSCPQCQGRELRPLGYGVGRTVSELGKAFPRVAVIRADGATPVYEVSGKPALVIATRGAEPVAAGGYHAALLLDGAAMVNRGSLTALEDTLRGWEHAISLVRESGRVFVTDVDDDPALAVATGSYHPLLRAELQAREQLRLPPAVRIAAVSGPRELVLGLADRVAGIAPEIDVLGPVSLGSGQTRSIVRFPYALGEQVQEALRAGFLSAVLAKRMAGASRLRVVVDNPRVLDELTEGT